MAVMPSGREREVMDAQSLKVPSEMMWGIYALYEQVFGRVRCPGGISDTIASTIGVKQECPLSPTLFGLYIDEIADFLTRGVTFSTAATHFTMGSAAQDRLTRGYAALAMLERRCHQAHFQEPRTKGWLFDSLVTPSLMYAAAVWGPGLATQWWTQLERPQIIMLSRLIRSKPSVPHDILRAEFVTPPMLVEALFQTICFLHRFREMPHTHLSYRAFEASRALAEARDRGCWYAQVTDWFT